VGEFTKAMQKWGGLTVDSSIGGVIYGRKASKHKKMVNGKIGK